MCFSFSDFTEVARFDTVVDIAAQNGCHDG